MSLLSRSAIKKLLDAGTIVIHPFDPENLNTSSYDVTLGEHYFVERPPEIGDHRIYNPYSEKDVKSVWIPRSAETLKEWKASHQFDTIRQMRDFENISDNDKIIWIKPQETILCHTQEFIGGRKNVTTMMKARSSMGRNFIEVCKCAGMGDIGFINRWTMEITNNSQSCTIPLVVGRRLAQIVFFKTDVEVSSYEETGKYQTHSDLELIMKQWKPDDMRPKLYLDRECKSTC